MEKIADRARMPAAQAPPPRWHEDFPVNWEDDHYVTRRAFTAFLTLISGSLFLGTGLVRYPRMVAAPVASPDRPKPDWSCPGRAGRQRPAVLLSDQARPVSAAATGGRSVCRLQPKVYPSPVSGAVPGRHPPAALPVPRGVFLGGERRSAGRSAQTSPAPDCNLAPGR